MPFASVDVNMCLAVNWTQSIFILAMQAILVIRVYALFNQSKKVLLFLTTFYALRATAALVIVAVLYNNRAIHESVIFVGPALGNVAQIVNINSPAILLTVGRNGTILYVVFDTILLFFALWAFLRHILEAKALDGGWSINVLIYGSKYMTDTFSSLSSFQTWMVITLAEDITGGVSIDVVTIDSPGQQFTHFFHRIGGCCRACMVTSLRETENKTRQQGGTLDGEMSTIRFDIREPPARAESVMEGEF
ncbi:hypothetical protein BJ138DRAFT_1116291 [Hygrophoropsis aurantiaca]|uniref:Uncharacterized protein n=1 Tax=Hygrophoropsis aurantiaca TaxID=72124 RepID=A0ACB8A3G9_9AGAM|nr:hypothetical protein BJ138DRAFT_1116291 [Hygrophoropsis aurantiaca]